MERWSNEMRNFGRKAALLRRPRFRDGLRNLVRRTPQRGVPTMVAIAFATLTIRICCNAQTRGTEFQLTKITKNLVSTPQFAYTGAQQYQTNQRDRWLEVEVEFTAAPEFTDELTFKYFVLLNGRLLTGEVHHINIAAGRERRSVMYVSPQTLARFMGNRALTPNSVQNIAVQIVQQSAVKDEISIVRSQPQWQAGLPQVPGSVLNKNETPFAPLYWDRYEQIKNSGR